MKEDREGMERVGERERERWENLGEGKRGRGEREERNYFWF